MRARRLLASLSFLATLAVTSADAVPLARLGMRGDAGALLPIQVGPGGVIDPQRHCQTVLRCQFARGGSYRGCISAYTCRACQFVNAMCTISGRERVCRQLRCSWGA